MEEILQRVLANIKGGFQGASLLAGLDDTEVGPLASEQAYGTEQDTLTCTRFASNDRETLMEVYVKTLDEGIVFDM